MGYVGAKPSAVPLTSADITDGIITSAKIADGTIVNADINASAGIVTSKLSGALGITEADQWRLTASLNMATAGITDITANLERNDSTGFGYVGTGMTQSSGIFTFPSTGIYLILVQAMVYGNGNQTDFASVHIKITTNNSTYSDTNTQSISQMAKNNGYATAFGSFIFDVTSTTNCKIKFTQDTGTSGIQLYGNTDHTGTGFTFIRLGDT
jgi:hypothetical protein